MFMIWFHPILSLYCCIDVTHSAAWSANDDHLIDIRQQFATRHATLPIAI